MPSRNAPYIDIRIRARLDRRLGVIALVIVANEAVSPRSRSPLGQAFHRRAARDRHRRHHRVDALASSAFRWRSAIQHTPPLTSCAARPRFGRPRSAGPTQLRAGTSYGALNTGWPPGPIGISVSLLDEGPHVVATSPTARTAGRRKDLLRTRGSCQADTRLSASRNGACRCSSLTDTITSIGRSRRAYAAGATVLDENTASARYRYLLVSYPFSQHDAPPKPRDDGGEHAGPGAGHIL